MSAVRAERGVTLIELMIVIVLLAIAVGIAVPSYRSYVIRTHRTEGTAALLNVRRAQEAFFLQNDRYVDDAGLVAAKPGGLGFPRTTERGFYQLDVVTPDPANPAAPLSFMARATAIGGQLDDDQCRTLTINDRGDRGATNPGGATSQQIIDTCWK
jgi:type IV pilus assembly protein PilE